MCMPLESVTSILITYKKLIAEVHFDRAPKFVDSMDNVYVRKK